MLLQKQVEARRCASRRQHSVADLEQQPTITASTQLRTSSLKQSTVSALRLQDSDKANEKEMDRDSSTSQTSHG